MKSAIVAQVFTVAALAQTPPTFQPSTENALQVEFNGQEVTAGDNVALEDTALSPAVDWSDSPVEDASSFVTLMIDLDASAQGQNLSPLLHWLSVSPSGDAAAEANATSGGWVPYAGPQPPPGSGKHRYVLLQLGNPEPTFAWPESFADFNTSSTEDRFNFDVDKFIAEGNLELLSANWFTTENTTSTDDGGSTPTPSGLPTESSSTPTTTPVPGAGASLSAWPYTTALAGLIALGLAAM